jgi:hypothetical protein
MSELYQVKLEGTLDEKWSDWFNGMTIEVEHASDGRAITTLTGPVADQARLRGVVSKIWDLNLTVISVRLIESAGKPQPRPQRGGGEWENS